VPRRSIPTVIAVALAATSARASVWAIPAEGSCTRPAAAEARGPEDAPPFPFRPGDIIDGPRVDRLASWLPAELWERRERFFFDGMRLEIGPCYRDYAPPDFFRRATERFRGRTRLDEAGRLVGYTAGLPFAPDTIDPDDPRAALKWAWNWVHRYRAGGRFGALRLSWVTRDGVTYRFEGDFFWVKLLGRADREGDGFKLPVDRDIDWVSGGRTKNLSSGSECRWRQYATGERRPDLLFWSPEARKVVRGTSPDSEGPFSACLSGCACSSMYLHGQSPDLHEWRVVGVRDLLAPINSKTPAYPEVDDRDFGPWGISFANDRWELRRSIVLEGRLKEGRFEDRVHRFVWYLDLQTLTPLYHVGIRDDGSPGAVGYFVGRWSEDRESYPPWPDDGARPVRVIDSVGAGLVDWTQKEGVRIEHWDTVAIPPADKRVKRMISESGLRRGR
jgi:hypothetical protein